MDLLEKLQRLKEESKNLPGEKNKKETIPEIKRIIDKSKRQKKFKGKTCPTCNKRRKIAGEKKMSKNGMIQWFQNFLIENKENLPLDWLRGQKLTFESVNEMRK